MPLIRRGRRWVEVAHRHDYMPRPGLGLNPDGSARIHSCECGARVTFEGMHDKVIVRR